MSETVEVMRQEEKTMQRFSVDQVKSIWGYVSVDLDVGWAGWPGRTNVHAAHGRFARHVHVAVAEVAAVVHVVVSHWAGLERARGIQSRVAMRPVAGGDARVAMRLFGTATIRCRLKDRPDLPRSS